ncbi:MAG: serpin family protein [Chitinivibrionales bacterium]|nr:serpin family protein [Chitinivibrionales bacterium]
MQKMTLFVWAILFIMMAGCSEGDSPLTTDTGQTSDMPFAMAQGTSRREAAPEQNIITQQASSINRFALAMYKYLAEKEGNTFFSPYSIIAALGMAEAGAEGETERQIREALFVTLSGDDLHGALNGLDLSLEEYAQAQQGVTLCIVNSIWAQTGWNLLPEYLNLLSRYYGAGVNLLDFISEPDSSRIVINTWVEEQTNQRIEDLIPQGAIRSDTRLVLTNAIHFLADWRYQFDPALTGDESFTRLDNSTITVPLMQLGESGEKVTMAYAQRGHVRAVDFPYRGNRLCMTVLLPDSGEFDEFENSCTADTIDEILQLLDSTKLPPVRLPKYTVTTASLSLVEALKSLGMTDAFDASKADFSGIDGTKGLCVSDVIHKAFIAVDESGTEAAAATAVVISRSSVGDMPSFVADRPFIYLIRDRQTGVILFMGRLVDPAE